MPDSRCDELRLAFKEVQELDAALTRAREKYDQDGGEAERSAAKETAQALKVALSSLECGVAEVELSKIQLSRRSFDTSNPARVAECLEEQKPLPEAGLETLSLREQYDFQVNVLRSLEVPDPADPAKKRKLLQEREGRFFIMGIDGKDYPLPSYEDILRKMTETPEKAEHFKKKAAQGFTRLHITPFALSLKDLIEACTQAILKAHREGRLYDTRGIPLKIRKAGVTGLITQTDPDVPPSAPDDEKEGLYRWDGYTDGNGADIDERLVYFPSSFDQKNHGGFVKQDILDAEEGDPVALAFPGFDVKFLENNQTIPRAGKGTTKAGRKHIEAGESPNDYLARIQQAAGESGVTPEDGIIQAISSLESGEGQIDNYDNGMDSISYNLGAYFPAGGDVPGAYWCRSVRRAFLYGVVPQSPDVDGGCRSAARITH